MTTSSSPGLSSILRLRSEEHTSELQSQSNLVCRLLLEKKKHMTKPLCRFHIRKIMIIAPTEPYLSFAFQLQTRTPVVLAHISVLPGAVHNVHVADAAG